jgi:branched-subunit amino acid aminotransferase/4-amino-4-deoxychorismate lyase
MQNIQIFCANIMFLYYQGQYLKQCHTISAFDKSYLLGDGFYTTLKMDAGRIYFLDKHVQRLNSSASALGFDWQLSEDKLCHILKKLYVLNQATQKVLRVRVTVSRGSGSLGLAFERQSPELTVVCSEYSEPHGACRLVRFPHSLNENSFLVRYKTTSRLEYVLAMNFAKQQLADDVVILNHQGNVLSTSCSTLLVCSQQGEWLTPNMGLDGVNRQALVEAELVKKQDFSWQQLMDAKCIALANSMFGLRYAYIQHQYLPDEFYLLQTRYHQLCQMQTTDVSLIA